MSELKFTWIQTHKQLADYFLSCEDKQDHLLNLLKKANVKSMNDKTEPDGEWKEMKEIDPFTFMAYINKYKDKRLLILQNIAQQLNLQSPQDDHGLPSMNAQKVWFFPLKYERENDIIPKLWDFFRKLMTDKITDADFSDILSIKNIGKAKLTEALFYFKPDQYLPIDRPVIEYLTGKFGINTDFNTFTEYVELLEEIQNKLNQPFWEISSEAWEWGNKDTTTNYWLVSPGEKASYWQEFLDKDIVCIGWDDIGDVSQYNSKKKLVEKLQQIENTAQSKRNDSTALYEFGHILKKDDIVIAKKGRNTLLGWGIVTSDYYFDEERENFKHCRKIDWQLNGEWDSQEDLPVKTLTNITQYSSSDPQYSKFYEKLMTIMKGDHVDNQNSVISFPLNTIFYGPPGTGKTYQSIKRAAEIVSKRKIDDYKEALEIYRKNLHDTIAFITFHQNYSYEDFVQGLRPETDKTNQLTFEKKDGLFKIMSERAMNNLNDSQKEPQALQEKERFKIALEELQERLLKDSTPIELTKSAYITGVEEDAFRYKGETWGGELGYKMKYKDLFTLYEENITQQNELNTLVDKVSGLAIHHATYFFKTYRIIKEIAEDLQLNNSIDINIERKNFVIIIDEINRANISRVFGELITLIEPDKRSDGDIPMQVILPSGDTFSIPSNLYIIGTMNTADKSIALLDIALRRRFEFEPMYPEYHLPDIQHRDILQKVNDYIIETKGHDFQIGHSYFMSKKEISIKEIMNKKVIPLLLEYYMNDEKEVRNILEAAGLTPSDSHPLQI